MTKFVTSRQSADVSRMKKSKSRARRAHAGPSKSDSQPERDLAAAFMDSLHQKASSSPSAGGLDATTTAELMRVAGQGARALLAAEAALKKLPTSMSDPQLEALDQIETSILIAQVRFKEIACAALYSLLSDFEMKPDDEKAFNEIIEDDEKHTLAELKNLCAW
jgi:hypothetical protein